MSTKFQIGFAILFICTLFVSACSNKTPEEHLAAAKAHLAEGGYNAAVIEAKNALQKSAKYADARMLLGEIYAKQGEFSAALGEYERALDLGFQDPRLIEVIANAKVRVGRTQEVIGELEDLDPRSAVLDLVLADAYLAANDLVAAKPLFEAHPNSARGQAGMAMLAWNAGDTNRATNHYLKALEIEPDDADTWLRLGELQLNDGAFEPAQESFARAKALPGGGIVGSIGVVRVSLAQGDLDTADTEVNRVLKAAPDYPLALYLRGLVDFQRDNIEAAEKSLRAVQSRYPDHGPTQYLMGLVKYKLGQFSQAEDNLKRYLARDKTNESVRKLLASVKFDRGDMDGVVDLLKTTESVSQDPQTLAMLGSAKLRTGDFSGATRALERAVELAPDMAPFRNQLALTLLSAGKQDRAEVALQDAIDVDENQFQSDYLIAMLKLRERNFEEAKVAIDALVRKSPNNPIGYNLRGAIALANDDTQLAIEEFERALEKSQTFEPAANNLARLHESVGNVDAAQAVFQRLLKVDSSSEGALVGLAELAVRSGDAKQAIAYLEKSVAGNPDSLRGRLGLARLYAATGDSDGSLARIDEALAIHKDHPDFLALQAQLDIQSGNNFRAERSITRLQTLLAKNPDNQVLTSLLSELQLRIGNRTMARRNYEELIRLSDDPPPQALLRLAQFDLAENKLASAERRLVQLQNVGGVPAPTIVLLEADILVARGKVDQASKLYQGLIESGNRDGVIRLSTVYFRNNKAAEGIQVLERWLTDHDDDQGARAILAGAQLSAGDQAGALQHYEALQDTGNPVILNNLAWIYMERGDSRAVALARQAAEAAPDNADIADTYGWILVQMGSPEQGIQALERSLNKSADNPTVIYHLAVAHRRTGNLTKAKQLLKRSLEFGEFAEREQAAEMLKSLG